MNKVFAFLYEVKAELHKVVWPKRNDYVGAAIIVCLLAAVFALILGFMDFGFSTLVKRLISVI